MKARAHVAAATLNAAPNATRLREVVEGALMGGASGPLKEPPEARP